MACERRPSLGPEPVVLVPPGDVQSRVHLDFGGDGRAYHDFPGPLLEGDQPSSLDPESLPHFSGIRVIFVALKSPCNAFMVEKRIKLMYFYLMRITVDIEEEVLNELVKLLGEKKKSPAVNKAVVEYVKRRKAQEFGRLLREGRIDYPLTNEEIEKQDV
jgi:Arc/MetJ family transcription regulator